MVGQTLEGTLGTVPLYSKPAHKPQDLIPLLSDVLAAPFGTAYPPLLIAAAKALQAIILTCWPRMAAYRGEILRGLVICWCRIAEDGSDILQSVMAAIKETVNLLTVATVSTVDIRADYQHLVSSDSRLADLFPATNQALKIP